MFGNLNSKSVPLFGVFCEKIIILLGMESYDEKVERWQRAIDRQVKKHGLRHVREIADLRRSVPDRLKRGDEKRLRIAVAQINPHWNVFSGVTLQYDQPEYPVLLRPWTIIDYHRPNLRRQVAMISIHGREVRFYDRKHMLLVRYRAPLSVPDEVVCGSWERWPLAVLLVQNYTGLRFSVEDLFTRLHEATFQKKKGGNWAWTRWTECV